VTEIKDWSFFNCADLTSVVFASGSSITKQWNNNAFPVSDYPFGGGNGLWTAYTGGRNLAGTYTRSDDTWRQTL
jgi:hypothetical protein